jgi:hypothetical protein
MADLSRGTSAQITPFSFGTHAVRIVVINGEPWFVTADVAKALGYRDAHNAGRILADHQRATHQMSTPGGVQEVSIVNESGMYRLVLRSRKAEALPFSDWVTSEVLPSIRKTGAYSTAPAAVAPAPKALPAPKKPAGPPPVILNGVVERVTVVIYVHAIGRNTTQDVVVPVELHPFKVGDLVSLAYAPGTDPLVPNSRYRSDLLDIARRDPSEFAELLKQNLALQSEFNHVRT